MARAKKEAALTPEERLQAALVPDWERPYKLPGNWCWTRMQEIAQWGSGGTPSRKVSEYYNGDISWVKTGELNDDYIFETEEHITQEAISHSSAKIYPTDTVVIAMYGATIGKVGILGIPAATNQACACAIVKPSTDYKYLFYYAQSQKDDFIKKGKGGAQPNISQEIIKFHQFPLPPLAEQQRIVDRIESLFTKLDEAKEKAQAVVDSFETRKAAILHKAFTGELSAKWREEHDVGMESWEKHLLSTVSSLQTGLMKGKKYTGKTVELPYLRVANVQDGFLRLDEIKKIDVEENAISRYSLAVGDVLFTEGGDFDKLGRGTVWEGQIKNCLHQNHIFVVRPNPEVLNPYFLSYQAGSRYGKAYFLSCSKQTTNLASINSTQLKNFPVLIPSMMEQEVIIRLLDSSLEKEQQTKNIAESVLDQIDLMKKSILARAFRGELGTNDPSEESAVKLLKQII